MLDREQDDKLKLRETITNLQAEINLSKQDNYDLYRKLSSLQEQVEFKDTQNRRLISSIQQLNSEISSLKEVKRAEKEKQMHRKSETAKVSKLLKSSIESLPSLVNGIFSILSHSADHKLASLESRLKELAATFKFGEILHSLDTLHSVERGPNKVSPAAPRFDELWPFRDVLQQLQQLAESRVSEVGTALVRPEEAVRKSQPKLALDSSLELPEDTSLELMLDGDKDDVIATAEAFLHLRRAGKLSPESDDYRIGPDTLLMILKDFVRDADSSAISDLHRLKLQKALSTVQERLKRTTGHPSEQLETHKEGSPLTRDRTEGPDSSCILERTAGTVARQEDWLSRSTEPLKHEIVELEGKVSHGEMVAQGLLAELKFLEHKRFQLQLDLELQAEKHSILNTRIQSSKDAVAELETRGQAVANLTASEGVRPSLCDTGWGRLRSRRPSVSSAAASSRQRSRSRSSAQFRWGNTSRLSASGYAESQQDRSYYRLVDSVFDELCLLFEQVKTWAETTADYVCRRPGPAVSQDLLAKLEHVYTQNREALHKIREVPDKGLEELSTVVGKLFELVATEEWIDPPVLPPVGLMEEF